MINLELKYDKSRVKGTNLELKYDKSRVKGTNLELKYDKSRVKGTINKIFINLVGFIEQS